MSNTLSDCTQKTKPELTAERARELFDYDPETGVLRWKVSKQGLKAGAVAGTVSKLGYVHVHADNHRTLAHRIVWLYTHGAWPSGVIDHINGDPSDNRICNLRDVSRQVNQQNMRSAMCSNLSTGLLGACYCKRWRKFVAGIKDPSTGKRLNLGAFNTAEEAHQAYLSAKRRLHAGCTI